MSQLDLYEQLRLMSRLIPTENFKEHEGWVYAIPAYAHRDIDSMRHWQRVCPVSYPLAAKIEQYWYNQGVTNAFIESWKQDRLFPELAKYEVKKVNTETARAEGFENGQMWVALVRTDVPFQILYQFAGKIAKFERVYQDNSEGLLAWVQGFTQAFFEYNRANTQQQLAGE